MVITNPYMHKQYLEERRTEVVFLDLESPVSNTGHNHLRGIISSVGYTDGRDSYLEYVKFSRNCDVSQEMVTKFNSPPSSVYKRGRHIKTVLMHLHHFVKGRKVVVFGDFDKKLITTECKRHNLKLDFDFLDFQSLVSQPNDRFRLSLTRMVEMFDIKGDFVEHNPLDDAIKLMKVYYAYEDTPDFRKKAFDYFVETEFKAIAGVYNSAFNRIQGVSDDFLGEPLDITEKDFLNRFIEKVKST